jgi:pyruvate dehydrogenase E2 component (dihydrolipoamide acetyltransferase)
VSSLFEFPLPDIGEGVAEGEIVEWKVAPGDSVLEDQVLLEVMTDKATVEITNPVKGRIAEIVAKAGAVVPVGAVLVKIEPAAGAHVPTIAAHGGAAHGGAAHGGGKAVAAAGGDGVGGGAATAVLAPPEPEFRRPPGERALATPYTRKLARDFAIDIETVRGTGEVGRVTPEDVQRAVAGRKGGGAAAPPPAPSLSEQVAAKRPAAAPAPVPAPAPAPAPLPASPGARESRVPIRGLRKKIAERMHQSKTTAAHFTYVDEFDATPLVRLRSELKTSAAERGVKLTYLPFILKAVVSAMRKFPNLNGLTDDARGEYVVRHVHNYGIAVDTDDGLIVPVVKDVDRRSILELAAEIERLSRDARDGKSKLEDLRDGSFTITNAGNIGGLFATPVINYPEAAILGVHAIKRKPWVVRGADGSESIEVRDVMYLSISIDHRMNDGAVGARWMNHVISLLAEPQRLLLEI